MKALHWIQFTWDLAALPAALPQLPEHYQIVPAAEGDEKEMRKVIASAFTLDPAWNPALQEALQTIAGWLDRAPSSETSVCLTLRHGVRIIGAAVLSLDPAAESHLVPGPCVSMEYRNRGFGTRLLEHSLATLRAAGLTQASALTTESSPATRFLYPKFLGVSAPCELRPALAA